MEIEYINLSRKKQKLEEVVIRQTGITSIPLGVIKELGNPERVKFGKVKGTPVVAITPSDTGLKVKYSARCADINTKAYYKAIGIENPECKGTKVEEGNLLIKL